MSGKLELLLGIHAQLLVERQQAGRQIPLLGVTIVIPAARQIEHLIILAVSILVEIAIGIIEQHTLGIGLSDILAVGCGHRLRKGRGILEYKAARG